MEPYLLLTLDFPPHRGGVARYYAGLSAAMRRGVVAVLTEPHPLALADEKRGVPVYRRRLLLRWFWPQWLFIPLVIAGIRRRFTFHRLLVGNILPLGYAALLCKWIAGMPFDVCIHGLDLLRSRRSLWKSFWSRIILANADRIIANSRWTEALIRKQGTTRPIVVVYPCPALPLPSDDEKKKFVERWNLGGKRVILSVSRLVARKGHDVAFTALAEARRTYPLLQYLVIGDGPDRDRLQTLAAAAGVADSVTFTGALPDNDIVSAFAASEFFLLPTRSEGDDVEGFGLVFLEAAAAGLPSIAGRGGGVSEAVVDEVTGFLVDPRDTSAITAAVLTLLQDTALRSRMGSAARTRVYEQFQWKSSIESLCRT